MRGFVTVLAFVGFIALAGLTENGPLWVLLLIAGLCAGFFVGIAVEHYMLSKWREQDDA